MEGLPKTVYEELRKYLTIYEEAVSNIQYDCATDPFLNEENFIFFFVNVGLSHRQSKSSSLWKNTYNGASAQGKIIFRDNELIGSNLYTKYCIILDETFVGTFQIV